MKKTALLLLLSVGAWAAHAQQDLGPYISKELVDSLTGPGSAPAEPFTIVGNLHYVGADNIASYLFTTPEGHILIDTGTREMEKLVRDNIQKLGFKLADVKIMLSSHAHFDHVAGHAAMQKATGARVMAIGEDAKALELGKDISPVETIGWPPVKVERILGDGDTVTLGGTMLRAVWTPGHTPGATTWVTTVRDGARSYNVVIVGGIGPNPGPPMVGNPKHPTLAQDTLTTIGKLRALKPDIQLGGHPRAQFAGKIPAMKGRARPHPLELEPNAWTRFLDTQEANFTKRIEADKAKAGGR
jgi:metallo-beta-lactamase class B